MTPEIKKRIENFRQEVQDILKKAEDDILNSLSGKVLMFSEKSYTAYIFPDKVEGAPDEIQIEDEADFYLNGYCLQLCFDPIPKFEVHYGSYNIEHPNQVNPKAVLKDWNEETKKEILDQINRIIGEKESISFWENYSEVHKKNSIYFMAAPPYLFGKLPLIVSCRKGDGWKEGDKKNEIPEFSVKKENVWGVIENLIFPSQNDN